VKTKCTHPVGGGSYTCISFGEPKSPIFAFHTVQDSNNGVIFGTNSGFEGFEDEVVSSNSLDTIRNKRKLKKAIMDKKVLEKIRMERQEALLRRARKSSSQPSSLLPLTAYQRVKRKLNQEMMSSPSENIVMVQPYEYRVKP